MQNYYEFSDLRQYRIINLQFYRSEVQNVSIVAEAEVEAGLHVFLEVLGKAPFFLPLQVPEATCFPCGMSLPFSEPTTANQVFLLMISLWF